MDIEFAEEQQMFQKVAKDFAEREVAPLVNEAEEKEEMPIDLFRKTGELGYLCPAYPEEYGGGGMGKVGECIFYEQMGRISRGIASGLMVQAGLGTSLILKYGNEEQRQEYFIPAVKGERIAAFGLTEPNAGSDAASIETTAKKVDDNYIVNGNKIYITNGPICDFILVAAYTDKSKGSREGISVLLLEIDKQNGIPGLSIIKMKKVGNRSAATAEITFDDCVIPGKNLVGEEGKGFRYLLEGLSGGRISHSACSLGVAQAALEASLDYAKQRVQFGQPIGKFQANAFKLAGLATEIEAARWMLYRAAWLYDQGRECRKEAAMTKFLSSEAAVRAATIAMEIHGGVGYMVESPVQRYYRDAILTRTTEGTNEIQQVVIARQLGL